MSIRVSVVVPLYNKERSIERALDSISAQTFKNFEVIVIDDGSTDAGPEIVRRYKALSIRIVTQRNAGPGAARNRGVEESKGELLAFLDADDEWLPNYLEESIRQLDTLGTAVSSISSGYIEYPRVISREPMWRARGIVDGPFRVLPETPPLEVVYRLAYMTPCSTVVRSDVLRKWGGFYTRNRCHYGEDAYVWLKVLFNETVAFNLKPLIRIHVEDSQLSRNLAGARPIEPFLSDPSGIVAVCPSNLKRLLSDFLAIRAFKTACMLGYWGKWREAKSIRNRFVVTGNWKLPYYVPSIICSTPIGSSLGHCARGLKRITA